MASSSLLYLYADVSKLNQMFNLDMKRSDFAKSFPDLQAPRGEFIAFDFKE